MTRVLSTIGLVVLALVLCTGPVAAQGGGGSGSGNAGGSASAPSGQEQGGGCTECVAIHDRDRDQDHGGDCVGPADGDPAREQARDGSTDLSEPAQNRAQDTEQAGTRERAQDGIGEDCDSDEACLQTQTQAQAQSGEQSQSQAQGREQVQAQTQAGEPVQTQGQAQAGDPIQAQSREGEQAQAGEQVATQARDRQNAGQDDAAGESPEDPAGLALRPAPTTAEATRLTSRVNEVLLRLIARLRLRLNLLRLMPQ